MTRNSIKFSNLWLTSLLLTASGFAAESWKVKIDWNLKVRTANVKKVFIILVVSPTVARPVAVIACGLTAATSLLTRNHGPDEDNMCLYWTEEFFGWENLTIKFHT